VSGGYRTMKRCCVWEEGEEEWTTHSVRYKQTTTTASAIWADLSRAKVVHVPKGRKGLSNLLFFLFNFGTLPAAAYQYPLLTSKILSTEDINLAIYSTRFEMEYTTPHVRCRETRVQRQDLHRKWNPRGSLCRRLGPQRSRRPL
jgi:hypothetical protein